MYLIFLRRLNIGGKCSEVAISFRSKCRNQYDTTVSQTNEARKVRGRKNSRMFRSLLKNISCRSNGFLKLKFISHFRRSLAVCIHVMDDFIH